MCLQEVFASLLHSFQEVRVDDVFGTVYEGQGHRVGDVCAVGGAQQLLQSDDGGVDLMFEPWIDDCFVISQILKLLLEQESWNFGSHGVSVFCVSARVGVWVMGHEQRDRLCVFISIELVWTTDVRFYFSRIQEIRAVRTGKCFFIVY